MVDLMNERVSFEINQRLRTPVARDAPYREATVGGMAIRLFDLNWLTEVLWYTINLCNRIV